MRQKIILFIFAKIMFDKILIDDFYYSFLSLS